jgi:hypothetical protein
MSFFEYVKEMLKKVLNNDGLIYFNLLIIKVLSFRDCYTGARWRGYI